MPGEGQLADAGLDKLRIPIYGSTATIHDSITQVEGSFDETMRGIENIRKHTDMDLLITTLIMKQNYKDILQELVIYWEMDLRFNVKMKFIAMMILLLVWVKFNWTLGITNMRIGLMRHLIGTEIFRLMEKIGRCCQDLVVLNCIQICVIDFHHLMTF